MRFLPEEGELLDSLGDGTKIYALLERGVLFTWVLWDSRELLFFHLHLYLRRLLFIIDTLRRGRRLGYGFGRGAGWVAVGCIIVCPFARD